VHRFIAIKMVQSLKSIRSFGGKRPSYNLKAFSRRQFLQLLQALFYNNIIPLGLFRAMKWH
jgi:hypothetical protein